MSFLTKMALLVEHNHAWQMAAQGCLNASEIVYHLQGTVCSTNTDFFLHPFLPQANKNPDCPEKKLRNAICFVCHKRYGTLGETEQDNCAVGGFMDGKVN